MRDDLDIIYALTESGADVNAPSTSEEDTPLQLATIFREPEVVEILLKACADVNRTSKVNKKTALQEGNIGGIY